MDALISPLLGEARVLGSSFCPFRSAALWLFGYRREASFNVPERTRRANLPGCFWILDVSKADDQQLLTPNTASTAGWLGAERVPTGSAYAYPAPAPRNEARRHGPGRFGSPNMTVEAGDRRASQVCHYAGYLRSVD